MERVQTPFIKKILLSPIAWLWESVHYTRRAFFDYGIFKQRSYQVPIISIGNLTFGGTGKTPFTLWIAKYFNSHNKHVMVLMRGYKGKLEKSSGLIMAGKKINPDPTDYGDEALLFARRLDNASVVVGRKRSENLSYYFPKVEPDVVLLEDGHQHIKIKRKINIVMFDALMPLHRYQIVPLGYMREGFSALKDADLVVIGRADQADSAQKDQLKNLMRPFLPVGVKIAEVGFRPNGFYNASNELILKPEEIKDRKVICLAGIANPKSFFKIIEKLGAEILVTESFPDHHFFNSNEINSLLSFAKAEDALILTTEKDMVRINKIINDDLILFLEVDIQFISGEEDTKEVLNSCFRNIY